jgi:hypothetical protein
MKFFGLGEGFDGGHLASAKDAGWFHIFVDESFDGKNELIVKRRHGLFG